MKISLKLGFVLFLLIGLSISSCNGDEDHWGNNEFVVAFKQPSENLAGNVDDLEIELVFSETAPNDGSVELDFHSDFLIYGEENDFITLPNAANHHLILPIQKGSSSVKFTIHKTAHIPIGDLEKMVEFSVVKINMEGKNTAIQGTSKLKVFFAESAALGGTLNPEMGGPNEPNQVYIELRSKTETKIRRDVWDLAFYSGEDFYVKLNSSLYMFAGALETTQIDAVTEADVTELKAKMNFLVEGSDQYVDHPNGDLNQLAIDAISMNPDDNKVYLLKMGNEIGTDTPGQGSVAVAGAERGYKKIRILRQGNDYLLQYADVNSSTHQEVIIPKSADFNFSFYSFTTASVVNVEPAQNHWDLNFTVTVGIEQFPGAGYTAYGYSDYVETNRHGGVKAYKVSTDDFSYDAFKLENIDETKFDVDQSTIGASWRKVTPPDRMVYDNIFYVVKDAEENIYKIKFTALENENGVRGYPQFKFDLLN